MERERRRSPRTAVLKRAKINFGNADMTQSVIDVVVLSISATGARVRTESPVTVPEWVTLVFPDGVRIGARRLWAQGNELGFGLGAADGSSLLDAMIAGLSPDQRRALIARIEASLTE